MYYSVVLFTGWAGTCLHRPAIAHTCPHTTHARTHAHTRTHTHTHTYTHIRTHACTCAMLAHTHSDNWEFCCPKWVWHSHHQPHTSEWTRPSDDTRHYISQWSYCRLAHDQTAPPCRQGWLSDHSTLQAERLAKAQQEHDQSMTQVAAAPSCNYVGDPTARFKRNGIKISTNYTTLTVQHHIYIVHNRLCVWPGTSLSFLYQPCRKTSRRQAQIQ